MIQAPKKPTLPTISYEVGAVLDEKVNEKVAGIVARQFAMEEDITGLRDIVSKLVLREKSK